MEQCEDYKYLFDETNDDFGDREDDENSDHVLIFSRIQQNKKKEEKVFAAKFLIGIILYIAAVSVICLSVFV